MVKKRLSGFKNIYVAPITEGSTFGVPVPIAGAKAVEAELSYETVQFYADDVMDTNENIFAGGEGTLTISSLTIEEYKLLFGATVSKGGALVKSTDIQPELALLFERGKLGSNGKMLYALYAVKFAPASVAATTREGTAEEELVELAFTIRETADNEIYYLIDSEATDVDPLQVSGWFTTVQKQGVSLPASLKA